MPLWQEGQDQAPSISRTPSGVRPRPIQPGLRVKAPRSGPGLLVAFRHVALPRPEKTLPQMEYSPGGWRSADGNGEAAQGPGVRGFILGLASLLTPSPAGLGRAESAGRLRSALPSPGEPRPSLQPRIWPRSSGITLESTEAHVPRTLQPRVTQLFLSGGPEPGRMPATWSRTRPPWPRPSGLETRLSSGPLKLRISDWRHESSSQGLTSTFSSALVRGLSFGRR